MKIEAKLAKVYRIRCDCGALFAVRTLGPSVECPECGRTALSTDLAADYLSPPPNDKRTAAA